MLTMRVSTPPPTWCPIRRTSSVERPQLKFFTIFFNSAATYLKVFSIPTGVLSGLPMVASYAPKMRCACSNCSDVHNMFINEEYKYRQ